MFEASKQTCIWNKLRNTRHSGQPTRCAICLLQLFNLLQNIFTFLTKWICWVKMYYLHSIMYSVNSGRQAVSVSLEVSKWEKLILIWPNCLRKVFLSRIFLRISFCFKTIIENSIWLYFANLYFVQPRLVLNINCDDNWCSIVLFSIFKYRKLLQWAHYLQRPIYTIFSDIEAPCWYLANLCRPFVVRELRIPAEILVREQDIPISRNN